MKDNLLKIKRNNSKVIEKESDKSSMMLNINLKDDISKRLKKYNNVILPSLFNSLNRTDEKDIKIKKSLILKANEKAKKNIKTTENVNYINNLISFVNTSNTYENNHKNESLHKNKKKYVLKSKKEIDLITFKSSNEYSNQNKGNNTKEKIKKIFSEKEPISNIKRYKYYSNSDSFNKSLDVKHKSSKIFQNKNNALNNIDLENINDKKIVIRHNTNYHPKSRSKLLNYRLDYDQVFSSSKSKSKSNIEFKKFKLNSDTIMNISPPSISNIKIFNDKENEDKEVYIDIDKIKDRNKNKDKIETKEDSKKEIKEFEIKKNTKTTFFNSSHQIEFCKIENKFVISQLNNYNRFRLPSKESIRISEKFIAQGEKYFLIFSKFIGKILNYYRYILNWKTILCYEYKKEYVVIIKSKKIKDISIIQIKIVNYKNGNFMISLFDLNSLFIDFFVKNLGDLRFFENQIKNIIKINNNQIYIRKKLDLKKKYKKLMNNGYTNIKDINKKSLFNENFLKSISSIKPKFEPLIDNTNKVENEFSKSKSNNNTFFSEIKDSKNKLFFSDSNAKSNSLSRLSNVMISKSYSSSQIKSNIVKKTNHKKSNMAINNHFHND